MAEQFEIAGSLYRFEGMPAQTESRILKRFAPLIADAVPLVLMPGARLAIRQNLDVPKVAQTVFRGWGKLSDDDLDMIERASLGALSRETGGAWVTVWPKGNPEPAFPDIDGSILEMLTGHSLGLVVKRWIDGGGEAVPAVIRAAIQQFH